MFSDNYYQTLSLPHISVISKPIKKITATGIDTESGSTDLDVLVYATGFKSHPFLNGLNIKGLDGQSLKEKWKESPKNYLGMLVDNFPNFFIMYGPNTNLGHSSIIIMSEAQSKYIAQCLVPISNGNYNTIAIKQEVLSKYYNDHQKRLSKMVWDNVDWSWYKTKSGDNVNNWAGRTMEYMRITKAVNFDEFQTS